PVSDVAAAVAGLTGRRVTAVRPIGGHVFTAGLAGGEVVVAKRHGEVSAALAEVTSLAWLAEPAAVRLPRLLGSDRHWVVLDRVDEGPPTERAAEALGRELAALHRSG